MTILMTFEHILFPNVPKTATFEDIPDELVEKLTKAGFTLNVGVHDYEVPGFKEMLIRTFYVPDAKDVFVIRIIAGGDEISTTYCCFGKEGKAQTLALADKAYNSIDMEAHRPDGDVFIFSAPQDETYLEMLSSGHPEAISILLLEKCVFKLAFEARWAI